MEVSKSRAICTPDTSTTSITDDATEITHRPNDQWDDRCHSIPWPGGVYNIVEKSSGRAMVLEDDRHIVLKDIGNDPSPSHRWQCVEHQGHFVFVNVQIGLYMSHDDDFSLNCWPSVVGVTEYVMPRKKPDGGYELLFPYGTDHLRRICVAEDGVNLQLRLHGITSWEFVKVE